MIALKFLSLDYIIQVTKRRTLIQMTLLHCNWLLATKCSMKMEVNYLPTSMSLHRMVKNIVQLSTKDFYLSVVQKKVDKNSNVAKLVPLTINVLPISVAKEQFRRILNALPRGASTWPSKLLISGKWVSVRYPESFL